MDPANPESIVVSHEEPYHGRIVDLHVDTILQPTGRTSIREVVLHPGGVVAVPVMEDGRLLMIRQFRYPLKRFILEFPAGKLDSQRTPRETIQNELEEEAGYRAGELTYECAFYTSPGISNEQLHLFIARNLSPVPQRLQEGEHISIHVHTVEECLRLMERGEIADGKTLLGLLWYLRKR